MALHHRHYRKIIKGLTSGSAKPVFLMSSEEVASGWEKLKTKEKYVIKNTLKSDSKQTMKKFIFVSEIHRSDYELHSEKFPTIIY